MENNDELKEIDIKNWTCYYFDDRIKIQDFDFRWYFNRWKTIQKYFGIWQFIQNFVWFKTIAIRFDKVDRFARFYDGMRYFVLFVFKKYDAIYNRIR